MTAPVRTTQLQNLAAGQPAEDDRLGRSFFTPAAGLHALTGIWPAAAGYVGEATLLSNTQLQVNPFRATIAGTQSGVQGDYTVVSDAVRTLTIGASHATLGRIDLVVSRVRDTGYTPNEGANDFVPPSIIPGTPAASPAAPATPANALVHGTLTVPAAGAAVTYTPAATGFVVALGGVRPSSATSTLGSGAYDGDTRYNAATGLLTWRTADARWRPSGLAYVTSTTRPTGNVPYGLRIFETDTLFERIWDGTYWEIVAWHGTRANAGASGATNAMPVACALWNGAAIANGVSTPFSGWNSVWTPSAAYANAGDGPGGPALFTYINTAGVTWRCNAKGRIRHTVYAHSDTGVGPGMSKVDAAGPQTANLGNSTQTHQRNTGYSGSGTLDQWFDAIQYVNPGDTVGFTAYSVTNPTSTVSYTVYQQVAYI